MKMKNIITDWEIYDRIHKTEVPLYDNYPIRPKPDNKCRNCKSSKWLYYHYATKIYKDRFKSMICSAAKMKVCFGYFSEEEFDI